MKQTTSWKPWTGTQVTESENHPFWKRGDELARRGIRSNSESDEGGNFTTQKSWVEYPAYPDTIILDTGWYKPGPGSPTLELRERASCALLPLAPSAMPFPPSGRSSDEDLMALGATAISRCAPRNNVADLATSLAEAFRDGVPHLLGSTLWKHRSGQLRELHSSLGDEYLNVQWGWNPLLGDVRAFAGAVGDTDRLYNNYARNSGKVVRRRYGFPSTSSSSETTVAQNVGPYKVGNVDNVRFYLGGSPGLGKVLRHRQTTVSRWFSGAFTYYVPPLGDSFVDHATRAIEVLGLDLNPATLWEAAPWSWAVDWFTNVGDLVTNVSQWSIDGLVLKYGYIMEHSLVRDTYTWSGDTRILPGNVNPSPCILVTETKLRRRATPFGFGISGGMTNRQKAITAALGMTRVRP